MILIEGGQSFPCKNIKEVIEKCEMLRKIQPLHSTHGYLSTVINKCKQGKLIWAGYELCKIQNDFKKYCRDIPEYDKLSYFLDRMFFSMLLLELHLYHNCRKEKP
jgi:hypothetical protein